LEERAAPHAKNQAVIRHARTAMLKTLDRYVIRQFLGTYFFILVLIMLIAVVFDASEKTEDFAKATASFSEIAIDYYLNFVLYYSNLFSGLLIFIAVLLFTSRLAHRTEVIALLSGGVSFRRFLWPYFVAATLLMLLSIFMNHKVLPIANKARVEFEQEHIWTSFRVHGKDIHREIAPGCIAYLSSYNADRHTGYRFSLERWTPSGELEWKLLSDRAVFDTVTGHWSIMDYSVRQITGTTEKLTHGAQLDTLLPLEPTDLEQRTSIAQAMTNRELNAYIKAEEARGGDQGAFYHLEKHQRTSYPFSVYVFTLIGVCIASRKVRGGTGLHLFVGVIICLLFVFATRIATVGATNSGLDPLLATWLPNFVFGLVGLGIYWQAPK
jgi:lipopolysaccharide export system permease protein